MNNEHETENTVMEHIEKHDGVTVKIKSVRGTGTRDQDTVNLTAHYDDQCEAIDHAENLNYLLETSMKRARRKDPNGDRE